MQSGGSLLMFFCFSCLDLLYSILESQFDHIPRTQCYLSFVTTGLGKCREDQSTLCPSKLQPHSYS